MRTNHLFTRVAAGLAIAACGFLFSCSEDEAVLQQEASEASEDAMIDTYYEDADDMGNVAAMGAAEGGRVSAEASDDRLDNLCVSISFVADLESTLDHPIGTITIDFGIDGCTDARGNVRKGKIVVVVNGRRLAIGSTAVMTFVGYEINGIKLVGTRTVTNISANAEAAPKFSVVLEDGVITWPDGTDATREHSLVREWHRENIPANDYVLVWGSASGENRRGIAYEMEIDENHPIRHNRFCPLPVSGIKTIVTAAHTIVVDFGSVEDGCDNKLIITVDGVSRDVQGRVRVN